MSELVEDVIRRYEERMPGASRARHLDPLYHHQVAWMRSMLRLADIAMEDEGMPSETRARVIRTVVYGGPNPEDSELRVELNEELVKRLAEQGPAVLLPDGWQP